MEFCLPRRAFVESISDSIFNIGERATIQAKSSAGSFGCTKTGSPTKMNQDLLASTNREPEARCPHTSNTRKGLGGFWVINRVIETLWTGTPPVDLPSGVPR